MLTRIARTIALAAVLAALLACVALAATPAAGHWTGTVTKGQAVSGAAGHPTFTVAGSHLQRFTIRGVGAYCFSGYSVVSVYVGSAAIHGGRFDTTVHPIAHANIHLTGHFTSPSRAVGTVAGSGYACDYTIGFVARRG